MSLIKLQLDNPCDQQWENMTPNASGSFCNSCVKNVIDFTGLTHKQILEHMKKSKGSMCARVSKNQLQAPLLDVKVYKPLHVPYTNVAASVLLATAVMNTVPAHASIDTTTTAIIINNNDGKQVIASITSQNKSLSRMETLTDDIIFTGIIKDPKTDKPLENVRITLYTLTQKISTYTDATGRYKLNIPNELLNEKNVIGLDYQNVTKDNNAFSFYASSVHVFTKIDIAITQNIEAQPELIYLGGISHRGKPKDPIVTQGGTRISYKEFEKAIAGKKSSCSITNDNYTYFSGDAAVALYGKKASHGLYVIYDSASLKHTNELQDH